MSRKTYTLKDLKVRVFEEPAIAVEKLTMPNTESNDGDAIRKDYHSTTGAPSKMYSYIPYIKINNLYTINPLNILEFKMGFTDFVPTLFVRVADVNKELKGKYYPSNGAVLNVYVGTIGKGDKYKPFRMDFMVVNISETGNVYGNLDTGGGSVYGISCIANIPELLYRKNQYKSGTSFACLKDIAKDMGLGFVSNVDDTNDSQLWINGIRETRDFMKDIVSHSYLDDESFFDMFIDPYYNLNFVEMNRLFYIGGENDTCTVYKTSHFEEDDPDGEYALDESGKSDEDKKELWNGREKEHEYEITNSKLVSGWTLWFEDYTPFGNNSSSISDGYVREAQWWDYDKEEYVKKDVVPYCYETPGLMPLNKGRLKDGVATKISSIKTYAALGNVAEEVSDNYRFARENNDMNLSDCKKFGIVVVFPYINPAITRGSRIKVSVFEQNEIAQDYITENQNMTENSTIVTDDGRTISLRDMPELQSDTTPRFDTRTEEGKTEAKSVGIYSTLQGNFSYNSDGSINTSTGELLNESLSGYYVVAGFEIFADERSGGVLKQRVRLVRREHKPALKADYKNTKSENV